MFTTRMVWNDMTRNFQELAHLCVVIVVVVAVVGNVTVDVTFVVDSIELILKMELVVCFGWFRVFDPI